MRLASVDEAVGRIARGDMVIVVDGPERENEGDLTMAAGFVSPAAVAFMIREARGLVCAPCDGSILDRLEIGPMVDPASATCDTAFAVSVDHRSSSTGISAAERAATVAALACADSVSSDFMRPGHVFPLRARPGGLLERQGHTEAAVDLCSLAGLTPCGVICEVLRDDGEPARLPDLALFARRHDLAIVSVDDLVTCRAGSGASAAAVRAR